MLRTSLLNPRLRGHAVEAAGRLSLSSSVDYSSPEYQYLERCRLPTYHFQPGLLRLPIPKLEDTFRRYQSAARPILSAENFQRLQAELTKFKRSDLAERLQAGLIAHDKANPETSYISEPWFDMYLKARVPIPVNYNPFMGMAPDPKPAFNEQITRATNLAISIGRFKRALDEACLSPEVFHLNPKKSDTELFRSVSRLVPSKLAFYAAAALFKAYPLDMSQHPFLFNTTRIPRKGRDEIYNAPGHGHILVMRRGHFFRVPLIEGGQVVPPQQLQAALAHIKSLPLDLPESAPASMLTALERDEWAGQREAILAGGGAEALEAIDSALFCLCLDEVAPMDEANPEPAIRSLLYGDGLNRWFDKSFSLIVGPDGLSTINFEHAWGDGVAVLRLMEEIIKDASANHWVSPDPSPPLPKEGSVAEISLPLPPATSELLVQRRQEYLERNGGLDFATLQYTRMNRNYFKKHKLSPDAMMQLGIQMAYHRIHGDSTATYESCSTSAFRKGRTETMRPATSETKRTVAAFLAAERAPLPELRAMIKECSDRHSQLVKEASMGQGFDRHLMGLRVQAEREGVSTGDFFTNPAHAAMNHFELSTSTLSTETLVLGGFGPVVPNGYGFGYNIVPKMMGGTVSTWREERNPFEFMSALEMSLDEIRDVLEATQSV